MRLIVLNQKKARGENMDYNSILEMDKYHSTRLHRYVSTKRYVCGD